MFYRRQKIVFHPHKQAAFLPRILEIQRFEVVTKTSFSVANDCNQAEVLQLLILVEGPLLALENHRHVELLDDQVHHLPGCGGGGHGDLDTCTLSQT